MPNPGRILVLADVLEALTADGHPTDADGLQRLRDRGLILFRGPKMTAADAERLRSIVHLRDLLGSSWTIPELAFSMMLSGIAATPGNVVAEHIEKQVESFLSIANRVLNRLGTDRIGQKRDGVTVEAGMARLFTRQFIRGWKLPETSNVQALKDVLESALPVLFGGMYFEKRAAELMPYLRRAVQLMVAPEDVERVLAWIAPRLDEFLPSLRVDVKENKLVRDVKRIGAENAGAVKTAVTDSARILRLVYWGLSGIPDIEPPPLSKTNEYIFRRMVGPIPALLAAMSMQDAGNARFSAFYSKLRSGSAFGLTSQRIAELYARGVATLEAERRSNQ